MRTELSSYKDILILTRKAEHVNYGNVKNIHQAEKKPAEMMKSRPVWESDRGMTWTFINPLWRSIQKHCPLHGCWRKQQLHRGQVWGNSNMHAKSHWIFAAERSSAKNQAFCFRKSRARCKPPSRASKKILRCSWGAASGWDTKNAENCACAHANAKFCSNGL